MYKKYTTSIQQVHNKYTTSIQQVYNKYTTSIQQIQAIPTLRVRPEEITHWTVVWDFLFPVDDANLINCLDRGGQSAVNTEYLVVDHCGEGQVVKHLRSGF